MSYHNINTMPGDISDREIRAREAGEIIYRSTSLSNYGSISPTPWVSENKAACCGIMSPSRRTFCLLVTFDLLLTFLLWVLYTQILGIQPLNKAFYHEVLQYSFRDSLFDTVMCSTWRCVPLLLCYALFRINKPWGVAVTTAGTMIYLLTKVFLFKFTGTDNPAGVEHNNIICYLLLIVSFIIAWVETWFLDFKVLPREEKVRQRERLLFGTSYDGRGVETAENGRIFGGQDMYHSLPESPDDSDREEGRGDFRSLPTSRGHSRNHSMGSQALSLGAEEQSYVQKAEESWQKGWEIYKNDEGWKRERGTSLDEGIVSTQTFPNIGKLFRLQAYVQGSVYEVFEELVTRAHDSPKWNPTVADCKVLQVITDDIDICYVVAAEAAGGLVSSRDFINLRHWKEKDNIIFSCGVAAEHPDMPPCKQHVRGENRDGGWAFSRVRGHKHKCMFTWIVNTDLKGWIPQYAVDQALTGTLVDFLKHLRARMAHNMKHRKS